MMKTRYSKRKRRTPPSYEDVMIYARDIWRRNPYKDRAFQTEDRDFREFFGCGVEVFITLWNLLDLHDLTPEDGTIMHLLWTLMFVKLYPKQKELCTLAGSVAKETVMVWIWRFIDAIMLLESQVVGHVLCCAVFILMCPSCIY
jgi:hypothetical protein